MPNCSSPSVDCSPIVQCPSSLPPSSTIKKRHAPSDSLPLVNLRCNAALYDPRFVLVFVANVQWWMLRRINLVRDVLQVQIIRTHVSPDALPNAMFSHRRLTPSRPPTRPTLDRLTEYWTVGYVLPPELLFQFVIFRNIETTTTGREFDASIDLQLSLANNPPRTIINFFNDPYVNGLGSDSHAIRLYRSLTLAAELMHWASVSILDARMLVNMLANPDISGQYNLMRITLRDYLRRRYPESRLGDEWAVYAETVYQRARASAIIASLLLEEHVRPESEAWVRFFHDYFQEHGNDNLRIRASSENFTFSSDWGTRLPPEEQALTQSWSYPRLNYTTSSDSSPNNGKTYAFIYDSDNISILMNGTLMNTPPMNATLPLD